MLFFEDLVLEDLVAKDTFFPNKYEFELLILNSIQNVDKVQVVTTTATFCHSGTCRKKRLPTSGGSKYCIKHNCSFTGCMKTVFHRKRCSEHGGKRSLITCRRLGCNEVMIRGSIFCSNGCKNNI